MMIKMLANISVVSRSHDQPLDDDEYELEVLASLIRPLFCALICSVDCGDKSEMVVVVVALIVSRAMIYRLSRD